MGSFPKRRPTICARFSSNPMTSLPSPTCGSCGTSWRGRDSGSKHGLRMRRSGLWAEGSAAAAASSLPWWCVLQRGKQDRMRKSWRPEALSLSLLQDNRDLSLRDVAWDACGRHFEARPVRAPPGNKSPAAPYGGSSDWCYLLLLNFIKQCSTSLKDALKSKGQWSQSPEEKKKLSNICWLLSR